MFTRRFFCEKIFSRVNIYHSSRNPLGGFLLSFLSHEKSCECLRFAIADTKKRECRNTLLISTLLFLSNTVLQTLFVNSKLFVRTPTQKPKFLLTTQNSIFYKLDKNSSSNKNFSILYLIV